MRNRRFFSLSLRRIPVRGFFFSFIGSETRMGFLDAEEREGMTNDAYARPVVARQSLRVVYSPPSSSFDTLVETAAFPRRLTEISLSEERENISSGRDEGEFIPELFAGGWTNCSPSLDPFEFLLIREIQEIKEGIPFYFYFSPRRGRKFQQFLLSREWKWIGSR